MGSVNLLDWEKDDNLPEMVDKSDFHWAVRVVHWRLGVWG